MLPLSSHGCCTSPCTHAMSSIPRIYDATDDNNYDTLSSQPHFHDDDVDSQTQGPWGGPSRGPRSDALRPHVHDDEYMAMTLAP